MAAKMGDYEIYTYEETDLKKQIIEDLDLKISGPGYFTYDLFMDKFD